MFPKTYHSLNKGMRPSLLLTTAMLFISGCVSTPEKQAARLEEAVSTPETYASVPMEAPLLVNSLLELFQDPQLAELSQTALANNPNLLAVYAQLEESNFNLKKAQAGLFPSFSADGSAGRSRGNSKATTSSYSAGLDASWEVDVWGGIRNSVKASKANNAALTANYEAAQQSLVAQSMQSWFNLITQGKLLDLAERRRDSLADTERLLTRQYESGTATLAALELARTDAANARADYQSATEDRNQAARALQTLLGQYPDASLIAARSWPALELSVPTGLPSELLLVRPDIVAAYQQILAADARVKVAYADLFPSFTLTASGGRSSDTLSNLGRSGFDVWSLAGQVSAPLLDGGLRRAELGAAGKRAEQAYQSYRSVVLNAFREVENALSAERYLLNEETARLEALKAARRAEAKTLRDYESGLTDILTLLEAQRRVFSTEERTINLHAARLTNRVSLALAIGRGV